MKMFLLLATIVCCLSTCHTFSQPPASGCDVITYDGRCFSYFTSSGTNWFSAGGECGAWGGHLATVANSGDDSLLATIRNSDLKECWIGLNDLDQYNVWEWIDGSNSTYRNWETGEPTSANKYVPTQNCVTKDWKSPKWDDTTCSKKQSCYYCSTKVVSFQIQTNSSIITTDNSVLYDNLTIQCITENKNAQQVAWSRVGPDGVRSDLSSPTDVTTGVSILSVLSDQPGYYSCHVTQGAGVSRTYGVRVQDPTVIQAPASGCDVITYDGRCFSYFTSSGTNWFSAGGECGAWGGHLATVANSGDDSLLATIRNSDLKECWIGLNDLDQYNVWEWIDGSNSTYRNWETGEPTSANKYVPTQNCVTKDWKSPKWDDTTCSKKQSCYYCSTKVIPIKLRSVSTLENSTLYENLTIQCITENKNAQQVAWSRVGPDGVRSDLSSPTDVTTGVSTLSVRSDQPGYYSCQVTQGAGVPRTYGVRVQDFSSLKGTYEIPITNFQTETSSPTSILATWNLLPSSPTNNSPTFSVHYGIGEVEVLAATTRSLSYNITGLINCVEYIVRLEMNSPDSNLSFYIKTMHSLKEDTTTVPMTSNPTSTQPNRLTNSTPQITHAIIALIVLILVFFLIIGSVNIAFCWWMARKRQVVINQANSQSIQLTTERVNLLDVTTDNANNVGSLNPTFMESACNEEKCVEMLEFETKDPDLLKIDSV